MRTIFGLLAVTGVTVGWISHQQTERAEARFMSRCMADGLRDYHCEVMWTAGQGHSRVLPIFVVRNPS